MKIVILSRRLLSWLMLGVMVLTVLFMGCAGATSSPSTSAQTSTTFSPTTPVVTTPLSPLESEGLTTDKLLFFSELGPGEVGLVSLYIINIDGKGMTKLVEGHWSNEINDVWWNFSLSPDRKHLAYFPNDSSGYLALNIINFADESITTVVSANAGGYAAWSPDGTRIAYDDRLGNLHVVNIDGTGDQKLASPRGGDYYGMGRLNGHIKHPIWSSDGKYILYDDFNAPSTMTIGSGSLDNRSIYLYSFDTGKTTLVSSGKEIINSIAHGVKALLHSDHSCFDIKTDGTGCRDLGLTINDKPQFSPDKTLIADFFVGQPLKILDAVSGMMVCDTPALNLNNFVWSPDSKHIAYVYHHYELDIHDYHNGVCVIRRDLSGGIQAFSRSGSEMVLVGWIQ
jgi:hypothetical protein